MENEYVVIENWCNDNFKYDYPDITFNLEKCKTDRLHVSLKEISGIYIIRNIVNNKFYIGSTKNYMKRITEHLRLLIDNEHHSKKLQNSINKHGFENFELRIYPINKNREFLFDIEEYLIQFYDTFVNGYNMSPDSRIKTSYTDEEKRLIGERLRAANLGKKCTEEHKKKVGKAKSIQNSGNGNPMSKLNKEKVLFIRKHILDYSCQEFCEMFNVKKSAIRAVAHLRSWNYPDCIPENYIEPKRLS